MQINGIMFSNLKNTLYQDLSRYMQINGVISSNLYNILYLLRKYSHNFVHNIDDVYLQIPFLLYIALYCNENKEMFYFISSLH